MSLEFKLRNIKVNRIPELSDGHSNTIELFWEDFIKPLLPDKDCVLKWNELLIRYSKEPDAVYAIRAFSSWSNRYVEVEKGDELRRGFLTIPNNATYKYFYTDNFFAAYFQKMALDNYCPTIEEFKDMMQSRKFPARFGRSCHLERVKASYKIDAQDPGISKAGYKIAHIIDAGRYFSIGRNRDATIQTLSELYSFPRGRYSDWQLKDISGESIYVRDYPIIEDTKNIMIAHFLRFVSPFNYFLAPKARYGRVYYNEFDNSITGSKDYDIAEYKPLLDYVHHKYIEMYGDSYKEYLKLLLIPDDFFNNPDGKEIINISYGNPLRIEDSDSRNSTPVSSTKTESQNINSAEDLIVEIARLFLQEGYSYARIESDLLGLDSNKSKGWTAMKLLRSMGITNDKKKILSTHSIDDLIADADGLYKEILKGIKEKVSLDKIESK